MNLGWDLDGQPGTAEHEIGHAIGLEHEHQHPHCLLVWDENAVLEDYMSSQGWSPEEVRQQVLDRLDPRRVPYTGTKWDAMSIMHYPFDARLIKSPTEYARNGIPYNSEISKLDRECVLKLYPKKGTRPVNEDILHFMQPQEELQLYHSVQPPVGEDITYKVKPQKSGKYEVIAHGNAEVMVIIEAIVSERRSYLTLETVDNSKKISVSLIADKDIVYNFTFRVLETRDSGNFCLLIGEAQ